MDEAFRGEGGRTIPPTRSCWSVAIVVSVTLLMCVRLGWIVRRYGVNIFFWDQWDFLRPLFGGAGLGAFFNLEHGPIREGVGALVISLTYTLTRWDARSDGWSAIVLLVGATVCLLAASRRLHGRLTAFDAVIPLSILTSAAFEILVLTPNPAHGPAPVLLVAAFCLSLSLASPWPRILVASTILFATIYTGFGLVFGPLALVVFAIQAIRKQNERLSWLTGLALGVASLVSFFRGYRSQPAAECFVFPDPHPLRYASFIGAITVRPFSILSDSRIGQATAAIGGAALVLLTLLAGARFLRRGESRDLTVFLLAGFSLAFATGSAVGRACMGPRAAESSRYVPYMSLAIVGGFLFLKGSPASRARQVALSLLLFACLLKEIFPERGRQAMLADISRGKSAWADCFRKRGDIARCDAETGFRIYPYPEATDLAGKLSFLRAHRLGLFKDEPVPSTAR